MRKATQMGKGRTLMLASYMWGGTEGARKA